MNQIYQVIAVAMALAISSVLSAEDIALEQVTAIEKQVPRLQFLDGHVEAVNRSTMSAQTSGVIETLNFDVDDLVEQGSVIATIRATNQQAGLQQARAGVSEALAGASQAKASMGQAQAKVAEAKADLSQARANEQSARAAIQQSQSGESQAAANLQEAQAVLKEAQSNFYRTSDIYAKRLIPRAEYDRAEAALSTAKAKVSSAKAQASSAGAQVRSSRAQLESAGSMVEAARARVGSAEASLVAAGASIDASKAVQESAKAHVTQAGETLDYTVLQAPYSGILIERHVQLGETVNPGTPVMTGISLDQMRVVAEVPQRLINQVRELKQAHVYLDGSSTELPVEKMTIFPYADVKTNAFRVRIDLQKGLKNLFPGMFVKVAFVMGYESKLVIPKSAVAIRSEVTGVYVINEEGGSSLRQIRMGREIDEENVSVLAGLSAGENVAVDPVHAVIDLKKRSEALTAGEGSHE